MQLFSLLQEIKMVPVKGDQVRLLRSSKTNHPEDPELKQGWTGKVVHFGIFGNPFWAILGDDKQTVMFAWQPRPNQRDVNDLEVISS